MLKSLIHYWRTNLAVLLGAAAAGSVLAGALMVGDSVKGSLRDLALDRLGEIDYAIVAEHLFRQDLASDLAAQPNFKPSFRKAAAALLLSGTAVHGESRTRASNINVFGVESDFGGLFFSQEIDFAHSSDQLFPSLMLNRSLADELGAQEGDQVLLSFQALTDIHPESLLGSRDAEDVVERIRLTVSRILPDRGLGRLGLRPNQNLPLNAFVHLPVLQERLGQPGRANAVFVAAAAEHTAEQLSQALDPAAQLDDYGLVLKPHEGYLSLESREFVLERRLADKALEAATRLQLPHQPVLTYLANRITVGDRSIPYSTVTAVDAGWEEYQPEGVPFGRWVTSSWGTAPPLRSGQIYLNEWAARELRPLEGDTVRLEYFVVGAGEELRTETAEFRLAGAVRIYELGADRHLTAEYPGIADAENMSDWDPPFPVNLDWIRPADEDYWDRYRATPKAFVNLADGQQLWSSRFGNLTAIRLAPSESAPSSGSDSDPDSASSTGGLQGLQAAYAGELLQRLSPEEFGFSLQPVKENGLKASEGATNFAGLFIGFSMFLIVSAALLVGLLFRLGVERRGREIGLLLALGFRQSKVRRRFLIEGGVIALLGSGLGLAGAVGYAWLMMAGLRTVWVEAVGSPFLYLHIVDTTLYLGFALSVGVVLFSIWQVTRKLGRLPASALMAGVVSIYQLRTAKTSTRIGAWAALALAFALLAAGFFAEGLAAAGLFFGVGACLLVAGLCFFAIWCRRTWRNRVVGAEEGERLLLAMASRNSSRNPGRSLLCAALVASACFMIVAVSAFHQDFGAEVTKLDSGAGGFALLASADIPIHRDLNDEEARFDLGISADDEPLMQQVRLFAYRLRPGDDASCLNLYKPEKPRVLGVPEEQIERGGFSFASTSEERENPWTLLKDDLGEGVVPAFADANSAQWILKVPLGGEITLQDELGREVRLRIVGLLQTSIFQSELLIAEDRFLESFPSRDGYSFFLVQAPEASRETVARELEAGLADFGFDISETAQRLRDFHAVQNTYLSTFQTLGGLGLLLGTLGLGVILTRNVIERRAEMAVMRAFGYRRSRLGKLVLAENSFLLALGMLLGTFSALIAVAPNVVANAQSLPWLSLAGTLLVILAAGFLSSSVSLRAVLKTPMLPALKEEK